MTGRIGITLGDIAGIGPEVTLKALATGAPEDTTRYLLIGNATLVRQLNADLGLGLHLADYHETDRNSRICLHDPRANSLTAGTAAIALAAVAWLEEGARLCLSGALDALVTAPVNKEAILRSGRAFVGQTEFLSALAGTDRTAMMLLGHDDRDRWLRVALVTTHLPLREVADRVSGPQIELVIELAAGACRDLSLPQARIGVCGLNPHAGEGGTMGTEEKTVIAPAVEAARQRGFDVAGPLPADTLFHRAYRGEFDAVVAMYHDQGLAPLKMIGFESGVNWTLGLPFIRTSPDHGTAYDIAGKGIANPSSMLAAIRLARQLAGRR